MRKQAVIYLIIICVVLSSCQQSITQSSPVEQTPTATLASSTSQVKTLTPTSIFTSTPTETLMPSAIGYPQLKGQLWVLYNKVGDLRFMYGVYDVASGELVKEILIDPGCSNYLIPRTTLAVCFSESQLYLSDLNTNQTLIIDLEIDPEIAERGYWSVSSNGRFILYQKASKGNYYLYEISEQKAEELVAESKMIQKGDWFPRISNDGQWIVYTQIDSRNRKSLNVINRAGTVSKISMPENIEFPELFWKPDSNRLIVFGGPISTDILVANKLYIVDLESGSFKVEILTELSDMSSDIIWWESWAQNPNAFNDNGQIFVLERQDQFLELQAIRLEGKQEIGYTLFSRLNGFNSLAWSPTSDVVAIAFSNHVLLWNVYSNATTPFFKDEGINIENIYWR